MARGRKATEFQVEGENADAPFSLKVHRGEGMALLAMNWRDGPPPKDFVGFAIEYREPDGDRFFPVKNRLSFDIDAKTTPEGQRAEKYPTPLAPLQKFRWAHFPRFADKKGAFIYRVTPVFMNAQDELSYGETQQVAVELARETYPGAINVAFTRGFVSSQAFVEKYLSKGAMSKLLPAKAADGLDFEPSHPLKDDAFAWMGFEARQQVVDVLAEAAEDGAKVYVIAYDLNLPELVIPLKKMKKKVKIIIDDSGEHGEEGSAENAAAEVLEKSAGAANVKRQHMGNLQHNKIIIVDGPNVQKVLCGSTNFSWRGFYVQANNAVVLQGAKAVKIFRAAFDACWDNEDGFGETESASWIELAVGGVDMAVTFSPHSAENAVLDEVSDDITSARSSVLYSLAFLYQTQGPLRKAITKITDSDDVFVYGISDKDSGLDLQKPDGNLAPVFAAALTKNVPEPFKSEPTGGNFGNKMHHKFVVLDFDTEDARVYTGSYNFSGPADTKNGENLLLIRDRKIAVSYMIEALRIFDHYHFRVAQAEAKGAKKKLLLKRPPRARGEKPWWSPYYSEQSKIRDRELFS